MQRILAAFTIMLMIGMACSLGYAEEGSSNKDWEFSLAPMYLWAVSIDGDQTVKGFEVDLDVPFSDIFDSLNGVGFVFWIIDYAAGEVLLEIFSEECVPLPFIVCCIGIYDAGYLSGIDCSFFWHLSLLG